MFEEYREEPEPTDDFPDEYFSFCSELAVCFITYGIPISNDGSYEDEHGMFHQFKIVLPRCSSVFKVGAFEITNEECPKCFARQVFCEVFQKVMRVEEPHGCDDPVGEAVNKIFKGQTL